LTNWEIRIITQENNPPPSGPGQATDIISKLVGESHYYYDINRDLGIINWVNKY